MNYVIPESVIQTEGFQVKSPANLFFLYMLSRNWHAWAAEYKPLRAFEQIYENQDAVAEELKQHPDRNYWTVVGIDECEYVEPGIQVWDSHGFYTHGFIETQFPSTGLPWPGQWIPNARTNAPGFTIEFQPNQLLRTVFVSCDLCPVGEVDDCDHWDGETGSWISIDFEMPDKRSIENFLVSIAKDDSLGVMSYMAAKLLISEHLNEDDRREEAQEWIAIASEIYESLDQAEREILEETFRS